MEIFYVKHMFVQNDEAIMQSLSAGIAHDPDLFMENQSFTEYEYTQEKADAYWQRQQDLERVHLAIMLREVPIGEIILKNIDRKTGVCTMGISMKNDSFKDKGYGTAAEQLALRFAFGEMKMKTVYADALLKNARSRHVLKKAGFREIRRDGAFCYYRCDRERWQDPGEMSIPSTGAL